MPSTSMTLSELIEAFASLWKLVAATAGLLFVIFFRKSIQKVIQERNFRFKRGQTEVSMEQPHSDEIKHGEGAIPLEIKDRPELSPAKEIAALKGPKNLFLEMFNSFEDGAYDKADAAFKALQDSEVNAIERQRKEIIYDYLMYTSGRDPSANRKIEKLAENPEIRETALSFLAICHEFSNNYPKAVKAYTRLLSEKIEDEKRADYLARIAEAKIKLGQAKDGLDLVTQGLTEVNSDQARYLLYKATADLHQSLGNPLIRAIALQKALQYRPEDTDLLFKAAYAQDEANLLLLSAANYSTLLRFQPQSDAALNNLGVLSGKLAMPFKEVDFYRRAVEKKNTLAMANLANNFIEQGFEKEANELLEQAKIEKEPDENVGKMIARLAQRKEEEIEKWQTVESNGIRQQQFFWGYAQAFFVPKSKGFSLAGKWLGMAGHIFGITQEDNVIRGIWEEGTKGEKFDGTLCNHAAQVKFYRKEARYGYTWPSLLGSVTKPEPSTDWSSGKNGFLYIEEDGKQMNIHLPDETGTKFLVLTRIGGDELTQIKCYPNKK